VGVDKSIHFSPVQTKFISRHDTRCLISLSSTAWLYRFQRVRRRVMVRRGFIRLEEEVLG
jgi:hypothetical protein